MKKILSLKKLINCIELHEDISISEYKSGVRFGDQFIFKVCDHVEGLSSNSWNSIDIYSGVFSHDLSFEIGSGKYYNELIYYLNEDFSSLFVVAVEEEVGFQISKREEGILFVEGERFSAERNFLDTIDWSESDEQSDNYTEYLQGWKNIDKYYPAFSS